MHTITKKEFHIDDFEKAGMSPRSIDFLKDEVIPELNSLMVEYNNPLYDKAGIFRDIINLLPSSYLQRRIISCNYEVLRTIYKQRRKHKLLEWQKFCNVLERDLPWFDDFIGYEEQ